MSNNQQSEKSDRRRSLAGTLSPWHYASQPELKEHIVNVVSEVNEIGSRYARNPNEPDATKLIRYFHGYLLKYVDLLSHGSLSKDGKRVPSDTRRFLSLFRSAASDRSRSMSFGELQTVADRIPNAFITMTADDIYNEMVLLFLELARKFDPEIGGFTGYIGYHFKYALKQRMFQVQRDALNYLPFFEVQVEDNELDIIDPSDEIKEQSGEILTVEMRLMETIGLKELNHSFVSTPPEHLEDALSKVQRKILVLHFCEGFSFSQISKQLNFGNASNAKQEYERAIKILQLMADIEVLGDK